MQHTADRAAWFIVGVSALHHPNKWHRGTGNSLPVTKVLIRMRTFQLSVSATPCTLLTSFCILFSLSLPYCLPPTMCVWVCALNRMDSLGTLKDGYIRGQAGLTPSSAALTFCLSPLKRLSHPLHRLIGHCHKEKKLKSSLNPIQCLRSTWTASVLCTGAVMLCRNGLLKDHPSEARRIYIKSKNVSKLGAASMLITVEIPSNSLKKYTITHSTIDPSINSLSFCSIHSSFEGSESCSHKSAVGFMKL